MSVENTHIPDGWTAAPGYIRQYQTDEQIREVVATLNLSEAHALADLGCGNGAFAIAAARQYPTCTVWALDPLESAVTECARRATDAGLANLHAQIASADSLPLEDSSVDRVLTRNVLHHVASPDAAFAELARVLKPGGIVLLETPCNLGDAVLGTLISDIHMLADDSHRRTYHHPDTITAGLAAHGIATHSVTTWPYRHGIGPEQMALVTQHNAENLLHPTQKTDDRWTIELNIVRIIGKKEG